MTTETQVMQIYKVNIIQAKILDLDATILYLEELIELLKAEAIIGENRIERAYEDLHEATGQRAIEESRFQRTNDELGLLLCKKVEKLPEPDELTEESRNSCTCDTYEWLGHPCPYQEDINDDHDSVCHCCPFCSQQCYEDT